MITTKLIEASKKDIFFKPQRVKIKHKTYRQLLHLDRPKKKIYVQSDNQNDDFLQKLLEEQAKEKKKKSLKKSKSLLQRNLSKKSKQQYGSQQTKKDSNNAKINNFNEGNFESRQTFRNSKDLPVIKYEKAPDSAKTINLLTKRQTSKSLKASKAQTHNQAIKIDQSNQQPYLTTNSFKNFSSTVKSSKGYTILKESLKKSLIVQSVPQYQLKHKIHPQTHRISHDLSPHQKYLPFKAKILSTKQLLAMSQNIVSQKSQKKIIERHKLFKNPQQQQIFMKNLLSYRYKK